MDIGALVTKAIDGMVHAIVDELHSEGDERMKAEIAFYDAIAEAYSTKARLLRSMLSPDPGPPSHD